MSAVLKHGDCLDLMTSLGNGSVDLVVADLPYGTTNAAWDSEIDLAALWAQYRRVVKDDGAILLFAQSPFDKKLAVSNLQMFRYEWIWEKTEATGHLNAKRMPMKAHENVLVFYRKLPTYNPQKTTGHVRKTALRVDRAEKQSVLYGSQEGITHYDSTERYPRSVLKFSTNKQRENYHPTQKPVELLEYLIATYSNPGDLILDNCMGSGSTGVAALNLGRRFIGMEITEQYFRVANSRCVPPQNGGSDK